MTYSGCMYSVGLKRFDLQMHLSSQRKVKEKFHLNPRNFQLNSSSDIAKVLCRPWQMCEKQALSLRSYYILIL